jgi:Transposase DDE domain/Transposase domain (DUF772)
MYNQPLHIMFKKNTKHLQTDMFGLFYFLPSHMQEKIKQSEEYHFYKLIFSKIDEQIFSIVYSDKKSRPNAPINSMISSLILMNRYNWTYEELFKQIQFNILTKIAIGLDSIDEMPFSSATLFNFQNRINDYFVKKGENLLEQVFDNLTAQQLKTLKIKTNIQRTDSFAAASNIRNYSRLQLLVELVIRIWRILKDDDKKRFVSHFESYTKKTSGQYIYSLKSADFPKELDKIGLLYHWIDKNLKDKYKEYEIFQTFIRIYDEHFAVVEDKIRIKSSEELSSNSVQSPDDIDAAYRKKNNIISKGQSINVVETAHPENKLNLIVDMDVNPVNKDDSVVLNKRLDKLKEKTPDLNELHFDGAYGSEENDKKFEGHCITPVQTAVKGVKADVNITIEKENTEHYIISCPYQRVHSQKARKRYKAVFTLSICKQCPLKESCPTLEMKKYRVYYFKEKDYLLKKRQRIINSLPPERRTLRNNVEATVNEFTCRLRKKKLKVRGRFKTTVFAYTVAASINFGRIFRYLMDESLKNMEILYLSFKYFKEQFKFYVKMSFLIKYNLNTYF